MKLVNEALYSKIIMITIIVISYFKILLNIDNYIIYVALTVSVRH